MEIRDLRADEIECRIGMATENGVSILLYKDARCDMNILDECIGEMYWKREHKVIGNELYCQVSIFNDKLNEWITKEDVGTESNTEKEKGRASDSFKRACVNWGIGRELYTAPFIWINSTKCKVFDTGRADRNGKKIYGCKDNFRVCVIEIEDKKIKKLGIDRFNKENGEWTSVFYVTKG